MMAFFRTERIGRHPTLRLNACGDAGREQKMTSPSRFDFLAVGDGGRSGDAIALSYGSPSRGLHHG